MKRKNIISLSVAFAFLSLSITGILLYVKQKAHAVEITHTIFGLIFVGFAIFHILNNWSSIVGYSKTRTAEKTSSKFKKEFIVAFLVFGVVLAGTASEILEPVAEAGKFLAPKRPKRPKKLSFEEVKTHQDSKGMALRVLVEMNKETELPIVAIWIEDSNHKFVENLYVPAKQAKMPESEEEANEGHFDISDFKPASLPTWQAKANVKSSLSEKETPHENFVLHTNTTAKGQFFVILEIKSKGKVELYEAIVNPTKGEVFKLKSKDNTLIMSGLVEL